MQAITNELLSGEKLWLFYPPTFGCDLSDPATDAAACYELGERISAESYSNMEWLADRPEDALAIWQACRAARNCGDIDAAADPRALLTVRWVLDKLPTLPEAARPTHRCTTKPGEMMVLPHHWWHMTLNLQETVIIKRACNNLVEAGIQALHQQRAAAAEATAGGTGGTGGGAGGKRKKKRKKKRKRKKREL